MRIAGIDPGADIGFCLLSDAKGESTLRLFKSPGKGCDEHALYKALVELKPEIAYVERVNGMPGQPAGASFNFGATWGLIRGVCRGLSIPYELVTPQRWKKEILKGFDLDGKDRAEKKKKQKAAAIAWVKRRYPAFDLIPPNGRVDNDNMAEAVCLAQYGQLAERGALIETGKRSARRDEEEVDDGD